MKHRNRMLKRYITDRMWNEGAVNSFACKTAAAAYNINILIVFIYISSVSPTGATAAEQSGSNSVYLECSSLFCHWMSIVFYTLPNLENDRVSDWLQQVVNNFFLTRLASFLKYTLPTSLGTRIFKITFAHIARARAQIRLLASRSIRISEVIFRAAFGNLKISVSQFRDEFV